MLRPLPSSANGSPPVTANHPSDVPCPLPRRIAWVRMSITSPRVRPSPNDRRVGIRIRTFEMLWGRRWARWRHRRLKQLADGASHVRTQRLEQVPYFSGARQDDHCGHRDESIQLVRCRHYSRHRASSTEVEPSEEELVRLLMRWRTEATKNGHTITRFAVAFEAGRDGFWLARWLRARDIETY